MRAERDINERYNKNSSGVASKLCHSMLVNLKEKESVR